MDEKSVADRIIAQEKAKKRLWMLEASKESSEPKKEFDQTVPDLPQDFQCPVCYEPMTHDRKPMTLSPCGHSICEICLTSYEKSTTCRKCCVCSQPYTKSAINYALLDVIQSLEDVGNTKNDFRGELKAEEAHMAKLVAQLKAADARFKSVSEELHTSKLVLEHMDHELLDAYQRKDSFSKRIQGLEKQSKEAQENEEKLKEIVDPLMIEVEEMDLKAKIERLTPNSGN